MSQQLTETLWRRLQEALKPFSAAFCQRDCDQHRDPPPSIDHRYSRRFCVWVLPSSKSVLMAISGVEWDPRPAEPVPKPS
jgi:hypothetical protein